MLFEPAIPGLGQLLATAIQDIQAGRNVEENFRIVFEHYYGPVFRFFQGKNFGTEDAQDLTQETLAAAYYALQTLREPAQFGGWLFAIARNRFRSEIARLNTHIRFQVPSSDQRDPDAIPDFRSEPDALTGILQREKSDRFVEALRRLPARMRRCAKLRSEGCSYEEIALTMSISTGAVKAHLHHAKKILQKSLAP